MANRADDVPAVLQVVDRWEQTAGAHEYLTVHRVLALMGLPDGDLGQLVRTLRRLWNAGMFEGHDMSSMGGGDDYMITGLSLKGQQLTRQAPSQPLASGAVVITQHGSGTINLGQVNTGQVRGNIDTHLNAVTGLSAEAFVKAVKAVADAVEKDETLDEAKRAETLEDLDYLAEEARKSPQERRPTMLRRIVGAIPQALETAETAKKAWDTFGPAIIGLFGQPGGS